MFKPLISDRLILRPINSGDAQNVLEHFSDDIAIYMFPTPSRSLEEASAFVEATLKNMHLNRELVYAITLRESNAFIGLAGLHGLESQTPELGVWTIKSQHGHHYGREAMQLVAQKAKSLGYTQVIYPVDIRNIASKKIPLYLNGTLTDEEKDVKTIDGRSLRIETYTIQL
ncbi:hypothetical protein AOC36_06230 [Erysipelothrix larvae]|uniref:N-acetyltransferase domain-containing protein n=1 Tax=Erysipelothrix larvae TaxID=1514105 RepID=A0A0X8H017_9FIRM|nr:GNAT family N-acetyltransferase [Erysipelothrix larvae]AMC93595.1 hypothetical protein AOC36_06230 [Erysipelothrix larvae]